MFVISMYNMELVFFTLDRHLNTAKGHGTVRQKKEKQIAYLTTVFMYDMELDFFHT